MATPNTTGTGLLPRLLASLRTTDAIADPHLRAALAEEARAGQAIATTRAV